MACPAVPRDTSQANNRLRTATGRGSSPVRITTLALPKSRMATVIRARVSSLTSMLIRCLCP